MNITAHQENEETRTGKRKAEERKQAIDFEEAVCCPSAVVQGAAQRKMKGSTRGNWDPRKGQQPFRPNPNGVGDRSTTLRRLLIGALMSCRALISSATKLCFFKINLQKKKLLKWITFWRLPSK